MKRKDTHQSIGLMSGTSLDGVDAILLETDGQSHIKLLAHAYVPYPDDIKARTAKLAKGDVPLDEVLRVEHALTRLYIQAVKALETQGINLKTVDVIGCHGQTIRHLPDEGLTWQLCDPHLLAEHTGIPVVSDFRRRDMAAKGQGAPLVPLFHHALTHGKWPCALLNLGGVANITLFDADGTMRASDCGPGCGLLDAWVLKHTGQPYDKNGELALKGTSIHPDILVHRMFAELPFFSKEAPKSADRYEFQQVLDWMTVQNVEDGAATLCDVTAACIWEQWELMGGNGPVYVVGGGANNPALMHALERQPFERVYLGHEHGFRGTTMEAEAFAWLAVRRLLGLPFSTPATTGCTHETTGGSLTA